MDYKAYEYVVVDCSTHPQGPYSVSHFDDEAGNIRFKRVEHSWVNGKCQFCGASSTQWKRGEDLETHVNILVRQSRLSGFIRATVPVIGSHQKCYAAKGSLHE